MINSTNLYANSDESVNDSWNRNAYHTMCTDISSLSDERCDDAFANCFDHSRISHIYCTAPSGHASDEYVHRPLPWCEMSCCKYYKRIGFGR